MSRTPPARLARLTRLTCFAAALALLATPALSLTVSEGVVGDFDTTNDLNAVTDDIGTLDLGLNTVTGSIDTLCRPDTPSGFICVPGPDHTDAFLVTVAPSERIVSILLTTLGTAPSGYAPSYGMIDRATGLFTHGDASTDFNATRPIIDGVPIGAGTYVLGVGQGLADAGGPAVYDWTLSVDVAPVPLPAGAVLLLTGLALLAGRALGRRS